MGWSIQDMTAPGCWFDEDGTEDGLGPWDWKVDVVREGDIAYGKFLGGKASFATVEWYAHLMNWRRSLPKYQMAERGRYKAATAGDKLAKVLAPAALDAIRENGALGSKELRGVCSGAVTPALLRSLGAKYKPLLTPVVKKNIMESVLTYLQMGTWSVVGDIERVFNGPMLTYKGWQISSNTTPEGLWGGLVDSGSVGVGSVGVGSVGVGSVDSGAVDEPGWARFMDSEESVFRVSCSPEESRELLIGHVLEMFPSAERKVLEKMI